MRTRYQEARRRAALARDEARLASVEARRAESEYHASILSLMGDEAVAPGCEVGDGFLIYHEVRVTEPWHVSLVRLDERPRATIATTRRPCAHCGRVVPLITRARYCGASCRVAASRARHAEATA